MIITYTGNYFDYDSINKDIIHIEDIIPSLTRINRFMGHTFRPYSVGEHTLRCLDVAKELGYTPREQLLVLIHDFTEAYCGDVNTKLKSLLPKYIEIEKKVETSIYELLQIDTPNQSEEDKIRVVDLTMLIIEMKYLTCHNYDKKVDSLKEYLNFDVINNDKFKIPKQPCLCERDIMENMLSQLNSLMVEVNGDMWKYIPSSELVKYYE